jgi:dienelactone hydrolase
MHDEAIEIAVAGLEPWGRVTLRLTAEMGGKDFVSTADFYADVNGRVHVPSQAPVGGSYGSVDAMGLFWSMVAETVEGEAEAEPEPDPWELPPPQQYALTALTGGTEVASASLERLIVTEGVTVRRLTEGRLRGVLLLPPGDGPHPAMIAVSGSNGGFSERSAAALASRGFAALGLAYFNAPDLPDQLVEIPLEYFEEAFDWLATVPEVDGDRIGVIGGSRGGELSLLLGSVFPQIRVVVAKVPSHVVWGGCCDDAASMKSSWTLDGQPVPSMPPSMLPMVAQQYWRKIQGDWLSYFWLSMGDAEAEEAAAIRVEKINGPVLLASGGDDQLWPSTYMADRVMARLAEHDFPHPYIHLKYDDAGHAVGLPPFMPTEQLVRIYHPVAKEYMTLGGTAESLARASVDSWQKTLEFLEKYLR